MESPLLGNEHLWPLDLQALNFHSRVTKTLLALLIKLCPHRGGEGACCRTSVDPPLEKTLDP